MRKPEWIITGEACSSSRHLIETLTNDVNAALVLPRGNADVERGVSVNNSVVTAERNKLGEGTISGLRATNIKKRSGAS